MNMENGMIRILVRLNFYLQSHDKPGIKARTNLEKTVEINAYLFSLVKQIDGFITDGVSYHSVKKDYHMTHSDISFEFSTYSELVEYWKSQGYEEVVDE